MLLIISYSELTYPITLYSRWEHAGPVREFQDPGPTLCRAYAPAQVASFYVERIDLASKLRELNKKWRWSRQFSSKKSAH